MDEVLRFWLDCGVDGFRVDVLWLLIKDAQFRDNPPNPAYRPGEPEHHRLLQTYSLIVAADNFYACKAGANAAEQLHRFIAVSSLTAISPMIPFLLQYPELFDRSSPHRRMFGLRARAPGVK